MPIKDSELKEGLIVRLLPWPENGIEDEEVGTIDFIADEERMPGEGREAIVTVFPEWRQTDIWDDGIREIFFDEDALMRTEIVT